MAPGPGPTTEPSYTPTHMSDCAPLRTSPNPTCEGDSSARCTQDASFDDNSTVRPGDYAMLGRMHVKNAPASHTPRVYLGSIRRREIQAIGTGNEEEEEQVQLPTTEDDETLDQFVPQPSKSGEEGEQLVSIADLDASASNSAHQTLFSPYYFYISRECPKDVLEFVLRSFGASSAQVGWDEIAGAGSALKEHDERITHHISDDFFRRADFLIIKEKFSAEANELVTVNDFAVSVDNREAISVSIETDAKISAEFFHVLSTELWMLCLP